MVEYPRQGPPTLPMQSYLKLAAQKSFPVNTVNMHNVSRIVKKVLHVERASEEHIRNWSFALEGLVETFCEKVGGADPQVSH